MKKTLSEVDYVSDKKNQLSNKSSRSRSKAYIPKKNQKFSSLKLIGDLPSFVNILRKEGFRLIGVIGVVYFYKSKSECGSYLECLIKVVDNSCVVIGEIGVLQIISKKAEHLVQLPDS